MYIEKNLEKYEVKEKRLEKIKIYYVNLINYCYW